MALVLSARPSSEGVKIRLGAGVLSLLESASLARASADPGVAPDRTFVSESAQIAHALRKSYVLREFLIKIAKWDEVKRKRGVSDPTFPSRSLGREAHLPCALSCDSHLHSLKKLGCLECSGRARGAAWKITALGRAVSNFIRENEL